MREAVEQLRQAHPHWIKNAAAVHLPAHVPPWTDTGLAVERGERLTILATGDVIWSRIPDLQAAARYHLWCRIGDGEIFRLGSDTRTLAAPDAGRLRLCIFHGAWASRDGALKPPFDGYASLEGGLDVLVIQWGAVDPVQGLDALAKLDARRSPFAAERERLRVPVPHVMPRGFTPLWSLGYTEMFSETIVDGAPAIAIRADADAGIVRHAVDLPLAPGTALEWTWRVNRLPSRVREDAFATHDYASVAVEFDDGRDLTWYWSASLPVDHHFECPLPRWKGIETHLVVRSGPGAIGTWVDERRDVHADAVRALGGAPARIVAVWLIAVTLFQRTLGSVDVRRIALVQERRRVPIFPAIA